MLTQATLRMRNFLSQIERYGMGYISEQTNDDYITNENAAAMENARDRAEREYIDDFERFAVENDDLVIESEDYDY